MTSDKVDRLAKARQKRGWTKEEIEAFAKRRALELEDISEGSDEPGHLASGTQKSIEEICKDNDDQLTLDSDKQTTPQKGEVDLATARETASSLAEQIKARMKKKGRS